jgi:hypothetical protein
MPLPPKAYYRLSEAAELLGCSVYDLIHWAVNGHTRLGVLYESSWYSGFAYIRPEDLLTAERTGYLNFAVVTFPDGGGDVLRLPEATINELFIHDAEFKILEGQRDLLSEEATRRTADRDKELQQAANQLANELKQRGRKVLSKREVAVALAKSDAWQDMTAHRIERVIRVEW